MRGTLPWRVAAAAGPGTAGPRADGGTAASIRAAWSPGPRERRPPRSIASRSGLTTS